MSTFIAPPALRRTGVPLLRSAARFHFLAARRSLDAITGQVGTLVRAATGTSLDSNGATITWPHSAARGEVRTVSGATRYGLRMGADDLTWPCDFGLEAATFFVEFVQLGAAIASGAGVAFQQIRPVALLATSNASHTPIIASLALGYIRMEDPKFSYTVVADLSDRQHPLYRGQDIAQLRARIASWARPGSIVRLDFAGGDWGTTATTDNPATATSVPSCTVQYSATEDPEKGPQFMTLVFNDVSAPS